MRVNGLQVVAIIVSAITVAIVPFLFPLAMLALFFWAKHRRTVRRELAALDAQTAALAADVDRYKALRAW